MLYPYVLNDFAEKFIEVRVNDDWFTPMEKFSVKTKYITVNNHNTWGCPVYILC